MAHSIEVGTMQVEEINIVSLSVIGKMEAGEIEVENMKNWEAEVFEKGYNVNEMDALLLQKIEELTLYVIDLKKEIQELKGE